MLMGKQPESVLSGGADKDCKKLAGSHNRRSQNGTHKGLAMSQTLWQELWGREQESPPVGIQDRGGWEEEGKGHKAAASTVQVWSWLKKLPGDRDARQIFREQTADEKCPANGNTWHHLNSEGRSSGQNIVEVQWSQEQNHLRWAR